MDKDKLKILVDSIYDLTYNFVKEQNTQAYTIVIEDGSVTIDFWTFSDKPTITRYYYQKKPAYE